jgi:serine/threonine-protein kinase
VVGPIARVWVRDALAGAASFEAACAELAARIPEPAARQAFVAAARQSRVAGADGEGLPNGRARATPGAAGDSPPPAPGERIDQATLEAATAQLSDDVGPIARIIVKRSAARAVSRAEFFHLLAAWIPTKQQQQEFLRQFGVGE